jgi:hypothetical protein
MPKRSVFKHLNTVVESMVSPSYRRACIACRHTARDMRGCPFHTARPSSVLLEGSRSGCRVERFTQQLNLTVLGNEHARLGLTIELTGVRHERFNGVLRECLVRSVDPDLEALELKIRDTLQ